MPAPLLSLPSKALHLVIHCLQYHELLQLSRCSTSTHHLIREWYLVKPMRTSMVTVFFEEYGYTIGQFNSHGSDCFWNFRSTRSPDYYSDLPGEPFTLKIGGKARELTKKSYSFSPGTSYCHVADHREPLFLELLKELIELFSLHLHKVEIEVEHVDVMEPLFAAKWLWKCDELHLKNGTVMEHEMTWILSNHQCKKLHFECQIHNSYDFGGTITVPEIHFYKTPISRRQLLDLSCEMIELMYLGLSNEDFNSFVKAWMNGDDQKLKGLMALEKFAGMEKLDEEQILEGIQWYPGRRKSYDPLPNLKEGRAGERFEKGRDVIRADGKMATLILLHHDGRSRSATLLQFWVWHQENADVEDEYYGLTELFHQIG